MYFHSDKKKRFVFSFVASVFIIGGLFICVKPNLFLTNTVCLWVLAFVYLLSYLYFVFTKIIANKVKGEHLHIPIYLSISFVLSLILLIVMPFKLNNIIDNNIIERNMLNTDTITFITTGEKNPLSSGYDIWLEGIRVNNQDYNLYDLALPDSWTFVEDRPLSTTAQVSSIVIDLPKMSEYIIYMRKVPSGGIVQIELNGMSMKYDLYNENSIQRNIVDLSTLLLAQYTISSYEYIIFYLIAWILYLIISLSCLPYVAHLFKKTSN